jgi:hypothetical protein
MSILQQINIGSVPNDGQGDDLREAFRKTRENFVLLEGTLIPNTINEILANATVGGGTFTEPSRFSDETESENTNTGALVINGGVGIGSKLNVGGNTSIAGNLVVFENISGGSFATEYANISGGIINSTAIGSDSPAAGSFTSLSATGNSVLDTVIAESVQARIGDITPDVGYFTSIDANAGISGLITTANQPNITGLGPLTGLTINGNTTIAGNVFFGTSDPGEEYKFFFAADAEFTANVHSTRIRSNIAIIGQNESTSFTNGALVVQGGAGVGGNLNVGTNITVSGNLNAQSGYVPTLSNSSGTLGQIAYDSDYVYICIATDTWKRSPLISW